MAGLRTPLLWMLLLLAADQGTKLWVRLSVPLHRPVNLIPNLIDLTHVENPGVSFSFLGTLEEGVRVPLLVGVSLLAVAGLTWYWLKHRAELDGFSDYAFVLILPGAVGNLIDRALYGRVTDFLHFRFYDQSFFVNNVADIWISLGVVSFLVGMLRMHRQHAAADKAAAGKPSADG